MRLRAVAAPLAIWSLVAVATSAFAQQQVDIHTNVLFYGDNTEFRNPFREGETLFGAAMRGEAEIRTGPRVRLTLGGFFNQRFGSDRAVELARPIVSLTIAGDRSRFVFGTFPAALPSRIGPDRMGPHGLLPPLQRETLTFTRPYEAGLLWTFDGTALRHRMWLSWQRLNTPEHRERLDGGLESETHLTSAVSLPVQIHVVHEGGQLYASGPVDDSAAAAAGVNLHRRLAACAASLELFALAARAVPDRSRPGLSRDGVAFFGRAAAEKDGWRAHLIVWRGRNFLKDEGDPNYLSVRLDGTRYRGTRDYSEIGVSRRFDLAPSVRLEASGRFHRIENHYEYSYRIVSFVALGWRVH
jgi:hypothetical protein